MLNFKEHAPIHEKIMEKVKQIPPDSNMAEKKEALRNWFVHNFAEVMQSELE